MTFQSFEENPELDTVSASAKFERVRTREVWISLKKFNIFLSDFGVLKVGLKSFGRS